jgi:hypothetical protein
MAKPLLAIAETLKPVVASTVLVLIGNIASTLSYPLIFITGTSIVIQKTDTEIVAGADSMLTHPDTRLASFSECKIRQGGDIFFAIAGHIREKLTGFDAIDIAIEALKITGNVADKVKAFEGMILTPLTNLLRMSRKLDPPYFENNLRNKLVLQVAFFGIQQQSLYLYVRAYKTRVPESDDIILELQNRTDCTGACGGLVALGDSDAVDDYVRTNPQYNTLPSLELVRNLVELEIQHKSDSIGPPIDIVRIDKTGANWIQRKPQCAD